MITAQPRGRILDVTPEQYHADPCEVPSLNASTAKLLVERSPLHAWSAHPRFGAQGKDATAAMRGGTVFHRLLLGKGGDYAVLQFDSYRTKAAQEARDAAEAAGKTPILEHQLSEISAAVDIARKHLRAHGISLDGLPAETAVEWHEPVPGTSRTVLCRAMFDLVNWATGEVFDPKTCDDASPEKCVRAILTNGYHIQHAAYRAAVRAIRPELAGRERFTFIFSERDAPYAVLPVRLDGAFTALGDAYWERAVMTWDECLRSNTWPTWGDGAFTVSPPQWAILRAMDSGLEIEP